MHKFLLWCSCLVCGQLMTLVKHASAKSIAQSFLSCAACDRVIISSVSTLSAAISVAASTTVQASSSSFTHYNIEIWKIIIVLANVTIGIQVVLLAPLLFVVYVNDVTIGILNYLVAPLIFLNTFTNIMIGLLSSLLVPLLFVNTVTDVTISVLGFWTIYLLMLIFCSISRSAVVSL